MSSDHIAISAREVSKSYNIRHNATRHVTLTELAMDRLRHPTRRAAREKFWALQDISFDVFPGEVFGIVGKNGAGKSTLLKILSRITELTAGEVHIRGRVGSLLEVGTGFHPELTGRENIYFNGAILGMSQKEIARQFDAIVDFAGVEKFLDTPVKRYSSGMYVRLAFAVAAHLETDVLIVDEVLAVGDAEFQRRCLGRIGEVAHDGRTVLVVSHNMGVIERLAERALLMDQGRVGAIGPVAAVVAQYLGDTTVTTEIVRFSDADRWDPTLDRDLELLWGRLACPAGSYEADDEIVIELGIRRHVPQSRFRLSFTVFSASGQPVGSAFSREREIAPDGDDEFTCELRLRAPLAPGSYHLGIALGLGDNLSGNRDFDVLVNVLPFEVAPTVAIDGSVATWTQAWGNVRLPTPNVTVKPGV